ncbi:MAG TPA: diacylglycerol kinase family protein [Thermoleophilaceae bacterium]|nr:diacylglycerol kinase family protein [Thermoleophilaceae bacterium]
MLVTNPAASRYSPRLELAVARELGAAFNVDLVRTEEPGQATAVARVAAGEEAVAAVAVLGGDGAVNEVANGLAGSAVALAALPGGRTNVLARTLGLPREPRAAAASLAAAGGRLSTRRIDLGTMNGRCFTFASGIGLSAVANRRLSRRGAGGRRLGGHLFVAELIAVIAGSPHALPPLAVDLDGPPGAIEGVSLMAQNADPLTYLGSRPLPLGEGAGLETGTVSLTVLREASLRLAARLTPQLVLGHGHALLGHEAVESCPRVHAARVRTLDGRSLEAEVDGDHAGEHEAVTYGVVPRALSVVTGSSVERPAVCG